MKVTQHTKLQIYNYLCGRYFKTDNLSISNIRTLNNITVFLSSLIIQGKCELKIESDLVTDIIGMEKYIEHIPSTNVIKLFIIK